MKFVGLIDIGSCHWRHRVFSGGYVTGRPCGTQECAGQVCGGVDIFSSEHMKFVGQLIDVGSYVGDIGFSAGAMLQEDLCRTQECAE